MQEGYSTGCDDLLIVHYKVLPPIGNKSIDTSYKQHNLSMASSCQEGAR